MAGMGILGGSEPFGTEVQQCPGLLWHRSSLWSTCGPGRASTKCWGHRGALAQQSCQEIQAAEPLNPTLSLASLSHWEGEPPAGAQHSAGRYQLFSSNK